jgi:glycosyltransferase involved in cell wall biosynthesis
VVHPRCDVGIDEASVDGDDAPGEIALVELPDDAVNRDGGVAADASAFARAIASVLDSDGMPALRRRGIERASTFTWQKAAAATVAVYEAAMDTKHT